MAIGTPSSTHSPVLAVAVLTLSSNAARADSELIRGMKCLQSIWSRIAASGMTTSAAPTDAGR
jgi:ABC-type transport system involved in cytochrome c biogenesis permease subunit